MDPYKDLHQEDLHAWLRKGARDPLAKFEESSFQEVKALSVQKIIDEVSVEEASAVKESLSSESLTPVDRIEEVLRAVPLLHTYEQVLQLRLPLDRRRRYTLLEQAEASLLARYSDEPYVERERKLKQSVKGHMSALGEPSTWYHSDSDEWTAAQRAGPEGRSSWNDVFRHMEASQNSYMIVYRQMKTEQGPEQRQSVKRRTSQQEVTKGEKPERRKSDTEEYKSAVTLEMKVGLATALVGLMAAFVTLTGSTLARAESPSEPTPVIIVEQNASHQRTKAYDEIDTGRVQLSRLRNSGRISRSEYETTLLMLSIAQSEIKTGK